MEPQWNWVKLGAHMTGHGRGTHATRTYVHAKIHTVHYATKHF